MIEIIIYLFPILILIGFIALGLKIYLNFKYIKITENYPSEINFFKFIRSFKYFLAQFEILFPIFLSFNTELMTEEKKLRCKKLEKYIKICLLLFYLGLLSIPIGIKLQEYYKIYPK